MKNQGIYVSLDIGTTSIKVVVAEYVRGQLNIIGVGNEKSEGLSRGVIVDIDETVESIRKAVRQAEQKSNIQIKDVIVGIPSNQISIEPCHGMIAVSSENREITDVDVYNVISAAKVRSVAPEREIISVIPEEFIVDGFQGIRDPRGMMGVRLEMRGLLYTGPRTILHNLRKTVERVGIHVDNVIISPLAIVNSVLNEGEREFGATVIDMGGGQTTVATIRNQELQFTNIYQEGGDYVTKDISKVLKTSQKIAESLKLNYGEAYVPLASNETFQVEVIGEVEPVEVTESYLAEIISARIKHIFDQIKQELERRHLLDLPGGIVLIGGNAILPGIVELAQEVFGVRVKLYVPNQVGIRNPAFAHVISLSEFAGKLTEVNLLAQKAVKGDEFLRQKPINFGIPNQRLNPVTQPSPAQTAPAETMQETPVAPKEEFQASSQSKPKLTERFRGLIGSMFDE